MDMFFRDEEKNIAGKDLSKKEIESAIKYNKNLKHSLIGAVIMVLLPFIFAIVLFLTVDDQPFNWYLSGMLIVFIFFSVLWLLSRMGMMSFLFLSMKNRIDKKQMKLNGKENEFKKMTHAEYLEFKKEHSKLPIYIAIGVQLVIFIITVIITYA